MFSPPVYLLICLVSYSSLHCLSDRSELSVGCRIAFIIMIISFSRISVVLSLSVYPFFSRISPRLFIARTLYIQTHKIIFSQKRTKIFLDSKCFQASQFPCFCFSLFHSLIH